ncbi:MAG: alpha/beta hydrolase [Burkholderiaceae bacterium]|nr:alpha/beta hydrolase [Burkholderiaceae bacterium]
MALIVFSHANSFPASTYRVLFDSLRRRGFTVRAIEKFGHDAAYPVTSNWPYLVRQLADFAAEEVAKAGQKAFFVGHSLGGFLSVMCAARHPHLARGVVMIDSPLLGGWKATAVGVAKRTQLVGSFSPGAISARRRNNWPDMMSALVHLRGKKAFAAWDEQVLMDYVEHCTHDQDGLRVLSFDRDIETAIYNTIPHHLPALLTRHALKCPASFIGGLSSVENRQVGLALTGRITQGRMTMLDGSHLFPMEKPQATAAAIEASLRNLGA